MLNIFSSLETAAGARAGSGLGACLPGRVGTVDLSSTGVMARPRPRAVSPADVLGHGNSHGRTAAFQGTAAGQGQPFGLQNNCEKYALTTRIAAASGGASGPHPARDPV
jgi:hypothetical protein